MNKNMSKIMVNMCISAPENEVQRSGSAPMKHQAAEKMTAETPKFDHRMAEDWARKMVNADGTPAPHWTIQQTNAVMQQRELQFEPDEFWIAMNAVYSDFGRVFELHAINNIDIFVDIAVAFWLMDEDAVPDKLAAYYTHVTKH